MWTELLCRRVAAAFDCVSVPPQQRQMLQHIDFPFLGESLPSYSWLFSCFISAANLMSAVKHNRWAGSHNEGEKSHAAVLQGGFIALMLCLITSFRHICCQFPVFMFEGQSRFKCRSVDRYQGSLQISTGSSKHVYQKRSSNKTISLTFGPGRPSPICPLSPWTPCGPWGPWIKSNEWKLYIKVKATEWSINQTLSAAILQSKLSMPTSGCVVLGEVKWTIFFTA